MSLYDKPIAAEKFRRFYKNVKANNGQMGQNVRAVHLNYNNVCNFKCDFCYTNAPDQPNARIKLDLDAIARMADQAHELGYYEFDLQGGELLINVEKTLELIRSLKPERFFVIMTTNGWFVTEEVANKLAEAGMDRLSVSVTGLDAEQHDTFMKKKGAHERAMNALKFAKQAGMLAVPTLAVGHYNAQSKELEEFCDFSAEHGYLTHFNLAMPSGCWKDNGDIMIDEDDRERINELRKKYDNIIYNMWNPFDKQKEELLGCNTVNRLYVTPKGDIFPCPFLHIKIGNIHEQSLREIVDYGFSIKHFNEYNPKCLAGEDTGFLDKYTRPGMSIFNPLDAHELFDDEDYVSEPLTKLIAQL